MAVLCMAPRDHFLDIEEIGRLHGSWGACPFAQEQLKQRLRSAIPKTEWVDIEETEAEPLAWHPKEDTEKSPRGARLKVEIVSWAFEGMRLLDQQRLVQVALQEELASGAIDALTELKTLTPEQWRRRESKRRLAGFEERLRAAIGNVEHLDIVDLTDGHAIQGFFDGSRRSLDPNGLELRVTIVSSTFEGMRPLARQQHIQDALGPEITSGAIHALPHLRTWTAAQWKAKAATADAPAPGCAKL